MGTDTEIVVITGAAGGIGSALARRYVAGGSKVALFDVDDNALSALATELADNGPSGDSVMGVRCDVTSEADCRSAAARVIEAWGGVDVLINNAGVSHMSPFADMDLEVFRRVVDINLFGSVNCTAACLDSLQARRGRIAVMSSVAGFAPLSLRCAYAASKHALHGFFDTLRAELFDNGVSVTIVCPAFVRTDIEAHMLGDHSHSGPRQTIGDQAEPADVADAIHAGVAARERMVFPTPDGEMIHQVAVTDPVGYDEFMRAMVSGDD